MHKTNQKQLIKEFYRGNKKYFSLSILAAMGLASINLAVSWIMQQVIDLAAGQSNLTFDRAVPIVLVFLAATVAILLCDAFFFPKYVKRAMTNYKNALLARFMDKEIADFSQEESSKYVAALTTDAESIETKYVTTTVSLITEAVSFLGAFALMLYYSPLMTLVSAILTSLPVLAALITGKKLVGIEQQISQQNANFLATISDFIQGFPLVKNFQAEKPILAKLTGRNEQLEQQKQASKHTKMTVQVLAASAGATAQLGVALFGTYLVLQNQGLTVGMIIIFIQLMNFIISPIRNVPTIWSERKAALGLIEKAAHLVEVKELSAAQKPIGQLQKSLRLKDVHFAYEAERPVLDGVSLDFEQGKSYALVGASGSGKSTLLKLLMREISPDQGAVYYDTTNLEEAGLDAVYNEISLIQQKVFIFNASILDNITMFQDFPEEKVKEVIRRSSLEKLIEEKGLDYLCGENGKHLSGGEKQRIAIARALLKNASIILTDEATSSLDNEANYQITKDILSLTDKTRIMVTHRLDQALLEKYDTIVVLRQGKIVEQGNFQQLLAADGYFKSLYLVG